MNKKGQEMFMVWVIFLIFTFILIYYIYTTDPDENSKKFCSNRGLEFNSSYSINDCKIVECMNNTKLYPFNFCNKDDNYGIGMATGMMLGVAIGGAR